MGFCDMPLFTGSAQLFILRHELENFTFKIITSPRGQWVNSEVLTRWCQDSIHLQHICDNKAYSSASGSDEQMSGLLATAVLVIWYVPGWIQIAIHMQWPHKQPFGRASYKVSVFVVVVQCNFFFFFFFGGGRREGALMICFFLVLHKQLLSSFAAVTRKKNCCQPNLWLARLQYDSIFSAYALEI